MMLHIPTNRDWEILIDDLGENNADKIKSTTDWRELRNEMGTWKNGTNESGFNAYPAGYAAASNGGFGGLSTKFGYWENEAVDEHKAYSYGLQGVYMAIDRGTSSKQTGLSCRCLLNDSNYSALPAENEVKAPEQSDKGLVIYATFDYAEFGDFYHLVFTDDTGKEYDFGAGENNYSGFEFGEESSNPDLVGEKFKIVWKNTKTKGYDDDGETVIEIDVPSIVSIELM